MTAPLLATAEAWLRDDPDPVTRAATQAMLGDAEALAAHFGQRLVFGTAGMRGPLGPGPSCMNQAMVRRVSAALGRYVLAQVPDAAAKGIVVGFDGRHGSAQFAEDTAAVLAGQGFIVYLHDALCPTPQLAHALLDLGCAAGVMVTASHNPPQDNGYKVYWTHGAQIIPPHDTGISAELDAIVDLNDIAVPELATLRAEGKVKAVPGEVMARYVAQVLAMRTYDGPTDLKIVYTAMHGVGRALIERVMADAGYPPLVLVTEQVDPDPDFPTVSFPNPEEPGALDLAFACANESGADLVVANDPDADRLAVCVPDGEGYTVLSGNQIGALLGDEMLRYGAQREGRLVATTVVSSSLLSRIAAAHGADYTETLTGFKWIADAAIKHEADGGTFVMGYEEALGYCVGDVVRDKDGVSAALLFCDLAARCKANGETVLERLAGLYAEHGLHASEQKAVKLPGAEGAAQIQAMMDRLRATPPTELAGSPVTAVRDLLHGEGGLPPSNVLGFTLPDARILARPSGTEPKIKFYFEVRVPLDGIEMGAAEAAAAARIAALSEAIVAAAEG